LVTLNFDILNKHITVPAPSTEVSVQEIYDQSKDFEDDPVMMSYPIICTATGKEPLGGNVFVGVTVTMQNGWKVGFEARAGPDNTACVVTGGNLVDSTGVVGAQFFTTSFVQIQYASSSSATLQQQQNIENIERHLEKRDHGVGKTYYWNPVNGDDNADGLSNRFPCKTFKHIHDNLIISGNNDIVYCITPNVDGIVTITEKIDITKSNVHLRGEGNRHVIAPDVVGDAVRIIGSESSPIFGVEFSGFRVEVPTQGANQTPPFNSGNQANIHLHWAYNATIRDCHFMFGQDNAVQFHFCQNVVLENLDIHENPDTGLFIWNSKNSQINNVRVFNNGKHGIRIQSDELWSGTPIPDWYISNIVFKEVKIYDNVQYGIYFTPTDSLQLGAGDALGEIEELLFNSTTLVEGNGFGITNDTTILFADHNHFTSIYYHLKELKDAEMGTWKIVGTQMIFYKADGVTEIFRRDLKDSTGNPSNTDVFQGIRV
jgi:hypothetical protein